MRFCTLFIGLLIHFSIVHITLAQSELYICENGKVHFVSEANLEIIEASSDELKGILDLNTNRFAFSIDIMSFTGFNSALQLEHFRENYMEISRFSTATFEGRLIEQVDLTESGTHELRAKGKMTIHGEVQEIILACRLMSDQNSITAMVDFTLNLSYYNIAIPKVVSRKIAEQINVSVNAVLIKK